MPHHDSLLSRPLAGLTRGVLRAPRFVLVSALCLAVFSAFYATRYLHFHTSRLDLLNPRESYNQRWLAYLEEFGDRDDVIVVVEGEDRQAIIDALEDVRQAVAEQPDWFHSILVRNDLSPLRRKGLHYLTVNELQLIDRFLGEVEPVLQGDWAQLNVASQLDWAMGKGAPDPIRRAGWVELPNEKAGEVASAAPSRLWQEAASLESSQRPDAPWAGDVLASVFEDPDRYEAPWDRLLSGLEQLANRFSDHYLFSDDGRVGFLLLKLSEGQRGLVPGRGAVSRLRRIVRAAATRHSQVRIGLTGMPVLESDEMETSQRDTWRATILSLIGVALVFAAGFGGWRGPLLAVATLLIALVWCFGFITVAVGHLNILSIAFGVILIGLGIDFGVHYLARYLQLCNEMSDGHAALCETARTVGPGLVSGGVTTALAFFAAGLTDFTGVAELGIVAGGGILLCLAAALFVLPALLWLFGRTDRRALPAVLPMALICRPVHRHSAVSLILILVITMASGAGIVRLRYDHNLLNLQAVDLESVDLERRLASHSDRSVWYAVSIADTAEEVARRKARFESLSEVSATEEIISLVPHPDKRKSRMIAAIAGRLAHLPAEPPLIPVVSRNALSQRLARMVPRPSSEVLLRRLNGISDDVYYARVTQFQQHLASELLRLLHLIRALADPEPPRLSDIAEPLRDRYVGRHGRFLLKVYGKGSIWEMEKLERFVRATEAIDPHITGHPVQTYYASRHMQRSYVHAAIYSFLAVAIVLMLDFRSVRFTLLAMLPMVLGFVQLSGLLGWLDIPLNPANMIVLPLILGIGIDDGVHVVHDFRRQPGAYRISNSTASAVVITSVTTMISFGSMMVSHHQGLRSLGQVLTLGVFCCLVSSLVVLPSLLTLLRAASQRAARLVN